MTDDSHEKILRLQALMMVQSADISSLLELLKANYRALHQVPSTRLDIDALFLRERKKQLHLLLESLELTNPTLAAKMLEEIDRSSTNFPLGYDEK